MTYEQVQAKAEAFKRFCGVGAKLLPEMVSVLEHSTSERKRSSDKLPRRSGIRLQYWREYVPTYIAQSWNIIILRQDRRH